MDKPWLASYPEGVPAEIDAGRYASLAALFDESFAKFADRPAYSNRGTVLSFADIDRRSAALAAWLRNELGLESGVRVAVVLPNLLQSPIAVFGVLRAGLTVVNVNPLYTEPELQHVLKDSGAKAVIVLENFAARVAHVLPRTHVDHVIVTRAGDEFPWPKRLVVNLVVRMRRMVRSYSIPGRVAWRDALSSGAARGFEPQAIGSDAIAFLQYTGGTTGRPKGAMLSHANMVANMEQATAWVAPFFRAELGVAVTALPLYHIFALTVNLLSFFRLGAHNLLITDPRDLPAFVRELRRWPFAFMSGVNTLFNALLRAPGFAALDFSRLTICLGGGMAVQRDVAERWQATTGNTIAQGYGLTEASPIVSANRLDTTEFNGSVGLPLPSTEVRIADTDGHWLDIGETGEICVRGPQVMVGYRNRPEDTDDVFFPGRWLRTGDVGRLTDDGLLFIEDRMKDMIIVSGFKVYPSEVEDVVTAHAGVHEAAVIGVPDEDSGEAVKLFVVREDPALTEREVLAHCRERLTAYKIPSYVEFIDELPKSNVGKVIRRKLREREDTAA